MKNSTVNVSLHDVPTEVLLFAKNNKENVSALFNIFGIHDTYRILLLIENELWARGVE